MKNSAFISLFFLTIFSCSKTDDLTKADCSQFDDIVIPPIVCEAQICQSDTCNIYYGIWKEIFLSKSQMTEDYFDRHITVCKTAMQKYTDLGIQFQLSYKLLIDWFEVKFEESFMICLLPGYLVENPAIDLPDSTLLSGEQISAYIDNPYFSSVIHNIASVDHLNYSSRQQAEQVLAHAVGVSDMCISYLYTQYQTTSDIPIGHPVLTADGTLTGNENKCITGTMDLATNFFQAGIIPCIIEFCFPMGTKIIQGNTQSRPIERIRTGDTILSFNETTLQTENDIVKQVDSVKHSNIVRISFNDLTVNENTFDHPYYVKNIGWCSYKPSLTQQKYNLTAKQLMVGDTCLKYRDNKLSEVTVESFTEKYGEVMTYNVSRLGKNKSYFANGILVSDENR